MDDYLNCILHSMPGFSPICEEATGSPILPPPIVGTYTPPPWNGIVFPPVVIIETPVMPVVETPKTVPEPAVVLLLCASLLSVVIAKRWRRA